MAQSLKNYLLNSAGLLALSALTLHAPDANAQTAGKTLKTKMDSAQVLKQNPDKPLIPHPDDVTPSIQLNQSHAHDYTLSLSPADKDIARMRLDSMINAPGNECFKELFDPQPQPHMLDMMQDYKNNLKINVPLDQRLLDIVSDPLKFK